MDTVTPYHFRSLACGLREINFGNTVMVQRENGERWLGYVQDIDEDLMLVNFASTTAPADWIQSRYVRAQRFLSDNLRDSLDKYVATKGSFAVQVALRNSQNGPHVFRPARLVTSTNQMGLFFVQLDDGNARQPFPVHLFQIAVAVAPAFDAPPLHNQTTGLYFRKFTVPYGNASKIRKLDALALRDCLYKAGQAPSASKPGGSVCCNMCVAYRIYVNVTGDCLSFICAQLHDRQDTMRAEWDVHALTQAFARFYPPSDAPQFYDFMRNFAQQGLVLDHDGWIGDVVSSVMVDVLFCLDLHTQAKAKRVCALWHQILSDHHTSRHIAIDSSILKPTNLSNSWLSCHNVYDFSWAVYQAVTTDTRSLTLIDCLLSSNVPAVTKVLATVLSVKGIQLDYILIGDGRSYGGITKYQLP
ncbi:uncharacterized protein LOC129590847 [Paramacrobiotus metropolitanus]|uniref:uncharacterized protein LOC129590847 n=1 Tax=Paramacrobiotus metropolitanus TaxID=2943436 RepID=UPI00244592E9|nr:uncharacterized protein LOC129590847 [Paramacrobiotus metropolitanus]